MEESSGLVESNLQCKTYETGTYCLDMTDIKGFVIYNNISQ